MTAEQSALVSGLLGLSKLMVIATVGREHGEPQAAIVGFSLGDSFDMYFGTRRTTRKWRNIQADPRVACVVSSGPVTVQLHGTAIELSGEAARAAAARHLEQNPKAAAYLSHPEERFFLVKPNWLRYTDLSKGEEPFFEVSTDRT